MRLSVIIPIMNEEENIAPMIEALRSSLSAIDHEIIFVDDGSTDGSVAEINRLADDRTAVVVLQKNYGQSYAMAAGIAAAKGELLVTMDGDLQNDPSDIPAMMQVLTEGGWDVVAGRRANRKDGMFLRKVPSKIANSIIRNVTDVRVHDYGCTLRVYKSHIAKAMDLHGELHRFIPVLAKIEGARITEMDVKHHPRRFGTSKYGIGRTFRVISDLLWMFFLQKYFRRPIHFFGGVGMVFLMVGVGINVYLLVEKLLGHDIWGRPIMVLGFIFLLAGLQMLTAGILAEVMMRTYFTSHQNKGYTVGEVFRGGKPQSQA